MVTSINLGNTFQSGGKTVFGGSSSGLDTSSIVTQLVDAKKISVTQVETQVDANTKKIAAYEELKTIIKNFETAAGFLRNKPGVNTAKDNAFEYRGVTLSTNSGGAAENYLSVTSEPGAVQANYAIEIQNIARAKIQTSDVITAADLNASVVTTAGGAGLLTAGSLTIKGTNIELEDGDSLNDVVSKINAAKGTTGVEATVIKTGANSYRLQLSATSTGTDADFDVAPINTDPGGVLENIGFSNTQLAEDAEFTLNGITITSQTNTVTDAVAGMTFILKQETGGTEINAKVVADTQLAQDYIANFVNAYNEFRLFLGRQTERGDNGLPTENAVLANDPMLRTITSKMDAAINTMVGGIANGNPRSLRDIGITFVDFPASGDQAKSTNLLEVDLDKLTQALNANYNGVRGLFEMQMTSSNSDFYIFESAKNIQVNDFKVNIDTAAGTAQAVYNDGSGDVTVELDYSTYSGGATIKGKAGTVFEGLTFIYASTLNGSVNVSLTQGIADLAFMASRDISKDGTGLVDIERTTLQDNTSRLNEEIARINEQIENFRQSLLEKFTALEQAISRVNSILQYLDAQSKARQAT